MIANYVSNRNTLLKIDTQDATGLSASAFKVDHCNRRIVQQNSFSLSTGSKLKVKVEILTTATVLEELTGDYIPIILARVVKEYSCDKHIPCIYLFSVDKQSKVFVALRKIDAHQSFSKHVSSQCSDDDSSKAWMAIDGPAIATNCDNKLYLCLPSEDLFCSLTPICFDFDEYYRESVALPGCRTCSTSNILNRLTLLDMHVKNKTYLVYILCNFECKRKCKNINKQLFVLNCFQKTFSVLNRNHYIPSEYDDVITCIKYIGTRMNGNHLVFAGTSEGYVMQIEHGCLKRCVSVGDGVCSAMSSAITSILVPVAIGTDTKDMLIVQDRCVFQLDNSFKVCRKWDSVYHILAGTFTSSGAWEFFLSLGDDVSTAPWLLTDLGNVSISSDPCHSAIADRPAAEASSNTQVAVQALQTRLQREEILLNEEKQKQKQAAHFLSECVETQLCIQDGADQYVPFHQPDMVPLISSPEVQLGQHPGTNSPARPAAKVEICEVWQRTCNGRWLIGVDFRNKTGRDLCTWLQIASSCDGGTQLTVTSTSRAPVCTSQSPAAADDKHGIQSLNSKPLPSADSCADLFSPGSLRNASMVPAIEEVHTVTCLTSMPMFGISGTVTVRVLLNWRYSQESRREVTHAALSEPKRERTNDNSREGTEAGLHKSETRELTQPRLHTHYCGEVNLQSDDVVQGKHELQFVAAPETDNIDMADIKDLKHNMLAWKCIQTITALVCRSTRSILSTLEQLLTNRCQFVYSHSYNCYVTQIPSLRHVQLCIGPVTSGTERGLDVYASCDSDLLLLLHHLYSCLPDHLLLLPQQTTSAHRAQSCLPSLQRELHFMSHGLHKLLKDADARRQSLSDDSLMEVEREEDLRKIGEKFKARREKLLSRSCETVSSEDIQALCEQVQGLRQDTDLAVVQSGLL